MLLTPLTKQLRDGLWFVVYLRCCRESPNELQYMANPKISGDVIEEGGTGGSVLGVTLSFQVDRATSHSGYTLESMVIGSSWLTMLEAASAEAKKADGVR